MPFSQSSAEFAQARRALTGYVMDDSTRTAVAAWFDDQRIRRRATFDVGDWRGTDMS